MLRRKHYLYILLLYGIVLLAAWLLQKKMRQVTHLAKMLLKKGSIMKTKKITIWSIIAAVLLFLTVTAFATNATSVSKNSLQEIMNTTKKQSDFIEGILSGYGISYYEVRVSTSSIVTGMDADWNAYDLIGSNGDSHILIVRDSDNDLTAILTSDGGLIFGLIDNCVLPMLFD